MKKFLLLFFIVLFSISNSYGFSDYLINSEESFIKWKAYKITNSHHEGSVGNIEGDLFFSGEEKKDLKGGSFFIDMKEISCSDIKDPVSLDELITHLKSQDFFAIDSYPQSSFEISKVEYMSENKYKLTGDLTIKDITNTEFFEADLEIFEDNKIIISGNGTLDRTKYDIRYGSKTFFDNLGDKAIKNKFDIEFKIVANKNDLENED